MPEGQPGDRAEIGGGQHHRALGSLEHLILMQGVDDQLVLAEPLGRVDQPVFVRADAPAGCRLLDSSAQACAMSW